MSRFTIQRDNGYADRIRKYKVILNGKEIGRIGNGEAKEFEAPTGENELFLKIDWCRSNKLLFSGNKDGAELFECGSNLRGIKLLFAIIYIFLFHIDIYGLRIHLTRQLSETGKILRAPHCRR